MERCKTKTLPTTADTQNCSYAYDDLTRIASANCGSAAAQTFSYDPFGNLSKSGSPFSFLPSYSASTNRMTSLGSFTPTYDNNGNLLNDNVHSYAWDAYGHSTTIDVATLTFDALDRLAEVKGGNGTTYQNVYAPSGARLGYMQGQSLLVVFIPLPGGATADYSSNASGTVDRYDHNDWLGSTRLTSTASRAFSAGSAYAPFGEPYAVSSNLADLSFTGQFNGTANGIYDFPFREYSIEGRWPAPDPAGLAAVSLANPQTWNRYSYVLNNPLAWLDPLGLGPGPCDDWLCVVLLGLGGSGLGAGGTSGPGGGRGGCVVETFPNSYTEFVAGYGLPEDFTEMDPPPQNPCGTDKGNTGATSAPPAAPPRPASPGFLQTVKHALVCTAAAPLVANSFINGSGATTTSVGGSGGVTVGDLLNGKDRNYTGTLNGDSWGNVSATWTTGHDVNGHGAAGFGWSVGVTAGVSTGTVNDLNGPGKATWVAAGPVAVQVARPVGSGGSISVGYGGGVQYAAYNETTTQTQAQTSCLYTYANALLNLISLASNGTF
jgi:RHS repeat-associated protein